MTTKIGTLVALALTLIISGCAREPETGDYLLTMCLNQAPAKRVVGINNADNRNQDRILFDEQSDGRWCWSEVKYKTWECEFINLFEGHLGEGDHPNLFVKVQKRTPWGGWTDGPETEVVANGEHWRRVLIVYKDGIDVPVVRPQPEQ